MRHHWLVIAAGCWLLLGDAAIGSWHSPASGTRAEATCQGDLRGCIVADLEAANPRLRRARAERIADAVVRYSGEHRLAPDLVVAVILVESTARPSARSHKGAIGLMQVMPHMFKQLGLRGNAAHIETNIQAGCMLLADNIRRLGEDSGILAYYWGRDIRGQAYLERVRAVRRSLATRLAARA